MKILRMFGKKGRHRRDTHVTMSGMTTTVDAKKISLPLGVDMEAINQSANGSEKNVERIKAHHEVLWDYNPELCECQDNLRKQIKLAQSEIRKDEARLQQLRKDKESRELEKRRLEDDLHLEESIARGSVMHASPVWTWTQVVFLTVFSIALLAMAMNTVSQVMIDSGVSVAFILNPMAARLVSLVPVGLAVSVKLGYALARSWRAKRGYFGVCIALSLIFGITWITSYVVVYASHTNDGIDAALSLNVPDETSTHWLYWYNVMAFSQILAECFIASSAFIYCDQLLNPQSAERSRETQNLLHTEIRAKDEQIDAKRREEHERSAALREQHDALHAKEEELWNFKVLRQAYLQLAQEKLQEVAATHSEVAQLEEQLNLAKTKEAQARTGTTTTALEDDETEKHDAA